jgi:hypothetical protein
MIVILFFLLVGFAISVLCIWAAIDASSYPEGAFDAAGTTKTLWIVLPIVGIFVCFLGIIAAVCGSGPSSRGSRRPEEFPDSDLRRPDRHARTADLLGAPGARSASCPRARRDLTRTGFFADNSSNLDQEKVLAGFLVKGNGTPAEVEDCNGGRLRVRANASTVAG